jgi:hypothetical protein
MAQSSAVGHSGLDWVVYLSLSLDSFSTPRQVAENL